MSSTGLSDAEWRKLPLKLRERWWRETDYGKREPSEALRQEIAAASNHRNKEATAPLVVTPEVRRVLACRSVKDKIAVAIDCDIAPVGSLGIVAELVREGYMVWIDRTTLPHVGVTFPNGDHVRSVARPINVDVYQLTARGIALCEQSGIKQK